MRTARVHRVRRIYAEGIFAIFILLLIIRPIYAAPTCPPKPGENKIGFCGPNMTYHEWGCISCPPGLGSSATCGKVYPKVIEIECQPCKDGTYSDENSFGQCKPCTTTRPCQKNEVQIGECKPNRNTLQCKCKKGYYKAFSGYCMPCSWCCRDKTNVYKAECQDLEKKCSYQDVKSCDPSTTYAPGLNSTTATPVITRSNTTDTSKGSKSSTDSKEMKQASGDMSREVDEKEDQDELLVKILCPSLLIIALAGICIFICCRRKKNGNSSNHDSSPEVSSLTSNELNSSALLIEEKDESAPSDKSENKIKIFSKDTVGYVNEDKVPLVTAPGNQGKLEDPGTDTGDYATESSTMAMKCTCTNTSDLPDDTENGTGEQLSKEEKLDLPVTKLPLKVYSKMCTELDVERPFFEDYRMLAEGLGVTVDEIKALQKYPTNSLLIKCQPTVRKLIEILTKELEREDVVEIIEGWLNQ